MKKALKICAVLALCLIMLATAAFVAYKLYNSYLWNNYLVQEKLENLNENINTSFDNLLYYMYNYPLDVDHYNFDYSWLDAGEPVLISHALGGIDEYVYTNSLEALELAYNNGLRVFEADIQMIDGELLLLHDEERTAQMCGFDTEDFSSEDFLNASIYGKYTPMTWQDLMAFMSEHPDMYVVTDTKYNEQPYMSYVISALAAEAKDYDPSILDRVIVQIYSHHMLDTVMDIYPFRSVIFTLYMSPDDDEKVRAFCAQSGVEAVTMHYSRYTEDFAASLNAMGVHTLVHTINDPQQAGLLSDSGVTGIYTDFLTPANITQ